VRDDKLQRAVPVLSALGKSVCYLALFLGMQVAVIEAARDLLGLSGADSAEFAPDTPHPVIHLMPDQRGEVPKGGPTRLGAYPCRLLEGSRLRAVYGQGEVAERHRHRYEVNNDYRPMLEGAGGLTLCGQSPDGRLVEAIERKDHPFFVGVQYHPEFKSRPNRAHPVFRAQQPEGEALPQVRRHLLPQLGP